VRVRCWERESCVRKSIGVYGLEYMSCRLWVLSVSRTGISSRHQHPTPPRTWDSNLGLEPRRDDDEQVEAGGWRRANRDLRIARDVRMIGSAVV
jgi:hypothetical protein